MLAAALGWIAIIVLVDLFLGIVVFAPGEDRPSGPGGVIPLADGTVPPEDERPFLPAMQASPWAEDYWGEFSLLRGDYEPFSRFRSSDASGEHINIRDGVRRSYQPDVPPDTDLPEVWFVGGSTMFGEGQRDLHTIPSEVARMAEAAGTPVHVTNLGALGYTSWQGLNRVMTQLAAADPPDLVVSYEGINDVNVVAEQLAGGRDDLAADPGHYSDPSDDLYALPYEESVTLGQLDRTWWERYRETSAVGQVAHQVLGWLSPPAGAQTGPVIDSSTQEKATLAADHIQRAQDLLRALGEEEGFTVVAFTQPWLSPEAPLVGAALAPAAVDLTGVLDDVPEEQIYLDGGHTNELGARLVAEAIWPHLQASLAAG